MDKIDRFFQSRTVSGKTWTIGNTKITPQSHALVVQLPFGGLVWNRPVAILVEEAGVTKRFPIFDLARITMLLLPAAWLVLAALAWLIGRASRE